MYEMFEKLSDFESETGHNYSDWDSLEKALDKKDEKRFSWIKLSVVFLVVLIPIELFEVADYSGTQHYSAHTSANSEHANETSNNNLIVEVQSAPNIAEAPNYLKAISNFRLAKTEVSNKIVIPQMNIAEITTIEAQKKNPILQQLTDLALIKISDKDQKTILTSETLAKEATNVEENNISEGLNVDPTPLDKENHINSFDLEIGVKSSFLNGVSNSSGTLNSWGIGAFCNLKYNIGKSFAVGFDAGINSEFNQDLNYSYLAESRTFFQRSDKFVKINTKQVYSTKLLLSANYKWNEKFITGGGIYYNFVLQTVSDIHEFGTGSFSNLGGETVRKRGYTKLLNRNEVGLCVSQTYRPNESWGLTLSFYKGLTNRVNTTYFPNGINKRTELSLMISKRIL